MKKHLIITALVMVFGLVTANSGMAQTTLTNPLEVTVSVEESCKIVSVKDIDFGTYDTTATNPDDDGEGNIVFQCIQGTTYRTYISGARDMTGISSSATLPFLLYSDSSRMNEYDDENDAPSTDTATNNEEITSIIYGRIEADNDVPVDDYSQTLTVNLEY